MTAAIYPASGLFADDEQWAAFVRQHSTVYRPGGDHGAYRRERVDRLVHSSMLLASAWAWHRGALVRHQHWDTDETARELGRAAGTLLRRAHEHEQALWSEVLSTREAPRCGGCGHLLTPCDVEGWHCEGIGCVDGQRWLEARAGRRGGGL